MGKIIYWIGVLESVDKGLRVLSILVAILFVLGILYLWYVWEEADRDNPKDVMILNQTTKITKILSVVWLGVMLASALIPTKQEMYLITLTKDTELTEIYSMTKDELKSGIDYFFDKVNELQGVE